MEKKLLFSTLIFGLHLAFASAFAYGEPVNLESLSPKSIQCDAPPPDSFRMTGYGYNFETFGWVPVSVGDNHVLTVFKENASNGWDSLYSVKVYNSKEYTLTNLQPNTRHKVGIRTKCGNDPSTQVSFVIPDHGVILELVIGGRNPENAQIIPPCQYIDFEDPSTTWIGFKVSRKAPDGHLVSYFEFERGKNGAEGIIKRTNAPNVLVAANEDNNWPTLNLPLFQTENLQFRVGEIKNLSEIFIFGFINVAFSGSKVSICPETSDPNKLWNNLYAFQLLQEHSDPCPSCLSDGNADERTKGYLENDQFTVQSPFLESLNIFFNDSKFTNGTKQITLMDVNGKIILNNKFNVIESQISIPLVFMPAGFYVLRMESNGAVQYHKVIKI